MKRALITLVAVLALSTGAAAAQAAEPGWGFGYGAGPGSTSVVAVAGTVVSVDAATSSFVANAYVLSGGHGCCGPVRALPGGNGPVALRNDLVGPWYTAPTPTQVTIITTSDTVWHIDGSGGTDSGSGSGGTLGGLAAGDEFTATFDGSPTDTLATIVSNPALSVFAHTPPTPRQLYAFVGTVNSVDTADTPNTLTVEVTNSVPSGLVPPGAQTFAVSGSTMILGGSTSDGLYGGTLADVAAGDVVAGVETSASGETPAQIESSPLQALIDFPAATSTTTSGATTNRARALDEALSLFGSTAKTTHRRTRTRSHRRRRHHSGK